MSRQARGEYLDPHTVQIVHTTQRCVRRAYLCGHDPLTGVCYDHRKQWIRDRQEFLASVFGIDCLTYAVMSNHLHLVLRSRPDVVATWSDEEIARRWLRLFPKRKHKDGTPREPTAKELDSILSDPDRLSELRVRLSDISWWMRCSSEVIARRSNREDDCTGRFWEGRFKAQLLLDEASLLACAMYVDLNPIRAAIAQTPEESRFTGAFERITDLRVARRASRRGKRRQRRAAKSPRQRSGWLSPIQLDVAGEPGPRPSATGRRASDKGFLSLPLDRYLELLDWTGRQMRADKPGVIPSELAPILQRLKIDAHGWCDLVRKFRHLFMRAVGTPDSLQAEAARRGQKYMQAPGANYLQAA